MAHEREIKFRVANFASVRRKLRASGAEYLGTFIQTDSFYDTAGRQLRQAGRGFRLRRVRLLKGAGGKIDPRPLLTYKGPRKPNTNGLKIRQEIQMHLDDAEAAVQMIRALGMKEHMTIQKQRASYRLGRCLVELDKLPLIGCSVEIEGPTEKSILAAAEKLALQTEPVKRGYSNLLSRECKRLGRSDRSVTF